MFSSWLYLSQQRAVFFRCLASLFDSGVPIVKSFELLGKQIEHPQLSKVSVQIAEALNRGHRLSKAMQGHPTYFTPLQIAMTRVGEQSGRLHDTLKMLAEEEEDSLKMRQKLSAGIVMPLAITVTCLALVFFVAPLALGGILKSMEMSASQIPWCTKILLLASDIVRSPSAWLVGAGAMVGLAGLARRVAVDSKLQLQLARQLDKIPGLGPILRMHASVRFLKVLEMSINSGLPLIESIKLAGESSGHPMLNHQLPILTAAVKNGAELDHAMSRVHFFPSIVIHGTRAGQESGSLTELLGHTSKILQLTLTQACETFTVALEPLVLAILGLLVGFCVVATLLPTIRMVESL